MDNTPEGVLDGLGSEEGAAKIVHAPLERSSYYARNVGAETATAEWLLFIDSDCTPSPSILDDYFVETIPSGCGALAGAITGNAAQTGLLARHARARGVLDQERLVHKDRPFAATANLLVRKDTWARVGGFHESIRSGGDVDFCWRIQDAGWTLLYRKQARVEHDHRERLRGLVRQYVRYGAGGAWLERRYPEAPRSSKHTALLIAAPALILGHLLTGKREQAAYRALDVPMVLANWVGRLLENRPARRAERPTMNADVALVTGPWTLKRSARCSGSRETATGSGSKRKHARPACPRVPFAGSESPTSRTTAFFTAWSTSPGSLHVGRFRWYGTCSPAQALRGRSGTSLRVPGALRSTRYLRSTPLTVGGAQTPRLGDSAGCSASGRRF